MTAQRTGAEPPPPTAVQPQVLHLRKRAMVLSLGVGVLMLGLKTGAYFLTGSTAILSDALESIVHVVATAFAMFSVVLASRPPDRSHPYGHGKVEYFSAGFEGALIMLAAVVILFDAVTKFVHGTELSALNVGAGMIAAAGAINLFLGLYLIRTGRRTHSLTLEADGKHVLTDSFTSLAVLIGIALVVWTGWTPLDPLIAMAVAIHILVAGGQLVFRSVRGLMDAADPEQLGEVVNVLSETRPPGWIDIHRLRMLPIGDDTHVDLHVVVPRFWDVQRAHDEQDAIARALDQQLPGRPGVLVHFDPCVDECCSFCAFEPCPIRAEKFGGSLAWSLEKALAPAHYFNPDDPE